MKRKNNEKNEQDKPLSQKPVSECRQQSSMNTNLPSDIKLRQLILFDDGSTMSIRLNVLGDISLNSRPILGELSSKALMNLEAMIKDYSHIIHSLSPSEMIESNRDNSGRSDYSWSYCKYKLRSVFGDRPLHEFINADGIADVEYTTMHNERFNKFEFCRSLLCLMNSALSNSGHQNRGNNALITLPKSLEPYSWLIHYHLTAMLGDNVSVQTILDSELCGRIHSDVCVCYSSTCKNNEIIDGLKDAVDGLVEPGYCIVPDQRSVVTSSAYHITAFLVMPNQAQRVRSLVTLNGSTLISIRQ